MSKISIRFDQPDGVFYAGQLLSGNVCVHAEERIKLKGITLKLTGKNHVHWAVRVSRYVTYHYNADETYFDVLFTLIEPDSGEEVTYLAPGDYAYPFQAQLSPTLPHPFHGVHGFVKYEAEARIIRPWKFDLDVKTPFIVLSILNLNDVKPEMKIPALIRDSKTISCCCCLKGFVDAEIKINKRCFTPGEQIIVGGKITNQSNTSVKKVTANLMQIAIFFGFRGGVLHTNVVKKCIISNYQNVVVPAKHESLFENLMLIVPSGPPSLSPGCTFIKVTYVLEVVLDIYCNQFVLQTDLIIGTELPTNYPQFQSVQGAPLQAYQNNAFDLAPVHRS